MELDDGEVALLRELLDSAWSDLRSEIADTDNAIFKRELKEREQTLRSIIERIANPG
jgi:hypothetical protein